MFKAGTSQKFRFFLVVNRFLAEQQLVMNYAVTVFVKIAQAGGLTLGPFGFHLFSLASTTLDHSATAPPPLNIH